MFAQCVTLFHCLANCFDCSLLSLLVSWVSSSPLLYFCRILRYSHFLPVEDVIRYLSWTYSTIELVLYLHKDHRWIHPWQHKSFCQSFIHNISTCFSFLEKKMQFMFFLDIFVYFYVIVFLLCDLVQLVLFKSNSKSL